MKRIIFIVAILLANIASVLAQPQSQNLLTVFDQPGWKETKNYSNGISVAEKSVPGSSLHAVKVSETVALVPETIKTVIFDVDHYRSFISSSRYLLVSKKSR